MLEPKGEKYDAGTETGTIRERIAGVGVGFPMESRPEDRDMATGRQDDQISSAITAANKGRARTLQRIPPEIARRIGKEPLIDEVVEAAKGTPGFIEDPIAQLTDGEGMVGEGAEACVYVSKDGKDVIKLNNAIRGENFNNFLASIAAHNKWFPNSAYRVLGFSEAIGDQPVVILRQRRVIEPEGVEPESAWSDDYQQRIDNMLTQRGLENIDSVWTNADRSVKINDTQFNNVLEGRDGELYAVDPSITDTEFDGRTSQELFGHINGRRTIGDDIPVN